MNLKNLFSAISKALSSLVGLGGSRQMASVFDTAGGGRTASGGSQPSSGASRSASSPSSAAKLPSIDFIVSPGVLGLGTSITTPSVMTSTEALPPSLGKIVSKVAGMTILPKTTEAETLSYVPSTLAPQKSSAGTPTAAPGTKTTTTPVSAVVPSGSSISGAPSTITTPASPQPSVNITPQGTPQITTSFSSAPPPSLSLAGGSSSVAASTTATPSTTTITPERMRELLRVLLSRERTGGLVESPEQIPLSYVLQPRRLLGEETFQQ